MLLKCNNKLGDDRIKQYSISLKCYCQSTSLNLKNFRYCTIFTKNKIRKQKLF